MTKNLTPIDLHVPAHFHRTCEGDEHVHLGQASRAAREKGPPRLKHCCGMQRDTGKEFAVVTYSSASAPASSAAAPSPGPAVAAT